jgi:hypothetical protein
MTETRNWRYWKLLASIIPRVRVSVDNSTVQVCVSYEDSFDRNLTTAKPKTWKGENGESKSDKCAKWVILQIKKARSGRAVAWGDGSVLKDRLEAGGAGPPIATKFASVHLDIL